MSGGLAVKALDRAAGDQLAGGQTLVTVEEDGLTYPVVILGDPVTGHGAEPHSGPVMAEACDWLTIDGIGVCREGHRATCGHDTTGRLWIQVD